MINHRIRVLVAEQSAASRTALVKLLESDVGLHVIGAVGDGQAALDFVKRHKPDVVLMDIHMPVLDGFEATRLIMQTQPLPIVICNSSLDTDVAISFRAMEAGAIACVRKPCGPDQADFKAIAAHLLETVRLMSEVKVVRRSARPRLASLIADHMPRISPRPPALARIRVIAMGASTGGPPVLQTILAGLNKNFPVPVLIVQHITSGFLPGMAEWLTQTTGFQVQLASHGTLPLPGHVYLAPDDFHMGVSPGGRILLSHGEAENGLRPAVSFLFRSVAGVYGASAVGVLLTGMGKDGAEELKVMRDQGAITIAQDLKSSVVHGMPGVAIALGGATHVLSADKMADALITLVNQHNVPNGASRS